MKLSPGKSFNGLAARWTTVQQAASLLSFALNEIESWQEFSTGWQPIGQPTQANPEFVGAQPVSEDLDVIYRQDRNVVLITLKQLRVALNINLRKCEEVRTAGPGHFGLHLFTEMTAGFGVENDVGFQFWRFWFFHRFEEVARASRP
jgi:hypothetical protein